MRQVLSHILKEVDAYDEAGTHHAELARGQKE